MNHRLSLGRAMLSASIALVSTILAISPARATDRQIPEALKDWASWATWDDIHRNCPSPYSDASKHLCVWPSRMGLQVTASGGQFDVAVQVFGEGWLSLPGGKTAWPVSVKVNGAPVAVVEHQGNPAVKLSAGTYHLEGEFRWNAVPQRISIPREIGLLALVVDGKPVETPSWDEHGDLWLKRSASTEEVDRNSISTKVYAVVEDGIPLWLHTEVELIVSGKSREEQIGIVVPEGWKLASVDGPIPAAVDAMGQMKAQVRAGRWTVRVSAFRLDQPKEFHYAAGAKPAVAEELVAFHAKPDFRTVEIVGPPPVDVSQTTFPEQWRGLPVYKWDTGTPFEIQERLRGMGQEKIEGLRIHRELWLDEGGGEFTFRDGIAGNRQQLWRLDIAPGQELGSVRSDGEGQLITRNPQNGVAGVEIRTRQVNLEATGRMPRTREISATGWQADADALRLTLNLPPGWRLLALFGADWVRGDWLTAWTLLDLFLLLVFTFAVFRMWGFGSALFAFLAFGLSYHEPGAPRFLWLILLAPLALQRVVPEGWGRRIVNIGKWIIVITFVLVFVPFVAGQVVQALYPQLESTEEYGGTHMGSFVSAPSVSTAEFAPAAPADVRAATANAEGPSSWRSSSPSKNYKAPENLSYDAKARIQTGPGVPEWKWREVSFGWNGPVSAGQQVHPVLISLTTERILTVIRVVLLLLLAMVLLGVRKASGAVFGKSAKAAVWILCAGLASHAAAQPTQIPDATTLSKLRDRLLEKSDAYPHAADIPSVTLTLKEGKVTMDAEVHAAVGAAVPLPGRLPAWSPVSVLVDDKPEVAMRRDDGYLWLLIMAGVHHVHVEGSLSNVTEWEWTYLLAPHQVKVDAPEWNVSGIQPDGVPQTQVILSRKEKAVAAQSSYEEQAVHVIAAVERRIELGLTWQVHTTVRRLSPRGKAAALRIPLLPGENVLTPGAVVKDGVIEARLGAQETEFTWDGELAATKQLKLATRAEDTWVERWHLVASPVWNVTLAGLAPIFEPSDARLEPVWYPWPGEAIELTVNRPEAIPGAIVTVDRTTYELALGKRQRTSQLNLSLRCSLGEDFLIDLPADAEITSLTQDSTAIPVRKNASKVIVPVHPGQQNVAIAWKRNVNLESHAATDEVRLPVEAANIQSTVTVPADRWVLWASGPQRGPAVRFWGILVCSLLAAVALGRMARTPMTSLAWMLLVIGLTQVPLPAALTVVGWLFFVAWRGSESFQRLGKWSYNLLQILLIALTFSALSILVTAVGEGLLGRPEMFIAGNDSTQSSLHWFQARSDGQLPRGACVSISIWWYRFFMLVWALWLAMALIRWLQVTWRNFGSGGFFRRRPKAAPVPQTPPTPPSPPPVPTQS